MLCAHSLLSNKESLIRGVLIRHFQALSNVFLFYLFRKLKKKYLNQIMSLTSPVPVQFPQCLVLGEGPSQNGLIYHQKD